MISGIIKVEVSVISRSRRPRLITLTETLIIWDITKLNVIIVLLYIVSKKVTTNTPSQGVRIDIVIGNNALHSQPTD